MMLKIRQEGSGFMCCFPQKQLTFAVHAHLLAQVVQAGQDYLEAPQYLLVLEFLVFL